MLIWSGIYCGGVLSSSVLPVNKRRLSFDIRCLDLAYHDHRGSDWHDNRDDHSQDRPLC